MSVIKNKVLCKRQGVFININMRQLHKTSNIKSKIKNVF